MSGVCPDPHECLPEDPDDYHVGNPEPVPRNIEYSIRDPLTTFVISGPVHIPHTPPPPGARGRLFTRAEARAWVRQTYNVVEEIQLPAKAGRWAFLVVKPGAPHGRYTPPPEDSLPERARRKKDVPQVA